MQVLNDLQTEKIICPGMGRTGTDEHFSRKRTEQVSGFADEGLAIRGEKCLVTSKPAAVASGEDGTRQQGGR